MIVLAAAAYLADFTSAAICKGPAPHSYQVAEQSNPAFGPAISELKKHPVATWYVDNGGDSIDALLSECSNDTPVIVVYGLPGKDCAAGFSGGGKNTNAEQYKAWVQSLATRVGNKKVIYILEPDAIGLLSNNDCAEKNGYMPNLQVARQILSTNTNAQIYADVAGWADQGKAISVLNSLGKVSGIAINTSNYKSTGDMDALCLKYSKATGGLHCIIDTSRNHNGSPQNEWCNSRSAGIGAPPTDKTDNDLVDYYLWLKVPGESDGQCYGQSADSMVGPAAGQFFADQFKLLWDNGYFVAHGSPKIGQTAHAHYSAHAFAVVKRALSFFIRAFPPAVPCAINIISDIRADDIRANIISNIRADIQTDEKADEEADVPPNHQTIRLEHFSCGGKNYSGSNQCITGCKCEFINEYYSQCRPVAASATEVAPFGRCGGIGYGGVTECTAGHICTVMNKHYSQCVPADDEGNNSSTSDDNDSY
uniref:Secreted protein n=1 Tax=Achlya hypogyna TaxID=1202772 RepID=A0A0A7CMY7_ACHHY|nr:secreted protein [Achlya hypogyna]